MAMAALEKSPSPFPVSSFFHAQRKKKKGNHKVHVEFISYKSASTKIRHRENPNNIIVDRIACISSMLQSCWGLEKLKQIHGNVVKCGCGQEISVAAKLIDLYATFGNVGDARLFFNGMQTANRLVWNTVIRACANNGLFQETLALYYKMQRGGIIPNKFTFPFVLKACAGLSDLEQGREIHQHIERRGLQSDAYIVPGLVNMYAKCGCIEDARQVFDEVSERNLVLWATMICRYVEVGEGFAALKLFHEMMQLNGIGQDFGCYAGGLRACGLIRGLLQGKSIHARVIRSGFDSESNVICALLDMYGKCGSGYVHKVFDGLAYTDLFIWNTMISACAKNGYAMRALELFFQMQEAGIEQSPFTFANVIPAFAHLGNLEQAKRIHERVIRRGFESNPYVGTALIDMYAKCGDVEIAREVFDKMPRRTEATWIAMIAGYRINDHGEHARVLFNKLQKARVKRNYKTSIEFLSQDGGVDANRHDVLDFTNMFNIEPALKHYARKVYNLGHAGRFQEACDFIRKMQLEDLASVWGILLRACRIHRNTEVTEHVAEKLFKLEPKNPKWYRLLSDVYAAAGRMDGLVKVRKMMGRKDTEKHIEEA